MSRKEEWVAARKALLIKEKEITRAKDALAAQVRDLPMVEVTKPYVFHTAAGTDVSLSDLFNGKRQLLIYHFMLEPDIDFSCKRCTFVCDHIPDVRHLGFKDTAFTAVSRAPPEKIEAYKKKTGWKFPWVSSYGSDFNYDFHVTWDESVVPIEYNFRTKDEMMAMGQQGPWKGERSGLSAFYKDGGKVYHTYSTYQRGLNKLLGTFILLDITPLGRQVGPLGPGDFKQNYEYDTTEA